MANPPITIGPFNNVPAPGSPIGSAWPQSVSTWIAQHSTLRIAQKFVTVSTNGTGDFAVGTGFAPTMALAMGALAGFPIVLGIRDDPSSAQVVFRAYNPAGGTYNSTVIGVAYAIWGLP